jgi:sugar lactone lactonase YvrE
VTFRGVLLFLVGFFSALSSAVAAPAGQVVPGSHQAPRVTASPFGIPFPASRNPQAWQEWHKRVRAQLEARRSTRARANASGTGSSGIIETIAGAAPFQKPVNSLKTGLGQIQGIAEDSNGNLYVASCDLGVVLKIDSASNTTVYAGQPLATGPAASTGDGGPATSARLVCPSGLALDTTGNLYVSDTELGTVRMVDAATGIIQTIAGTPGQRGYGGDGGAATAAMLDFPTGLALDGSGDLFIEDVQWIREVNLTTGLIQTIAGGIPSPVPCPLSATTTCPATQVDFDAFGCSIVFAQGHLYAGLNSVYTGSAYFDGSIVSIDPSSGAMQLIAGGGPNAGTSPTYPAIGMEMGPWGLAADAAGNLFITNPAQALGTWNRSAPLVPSIEELSASDHALHVIAGNGDPHDYSGSGDGGAATKAGLGYPEAICLSPPGSVVFADNFRIRSFTVGGNIATVAGVVPANYFGDNGAATQAGLDQPSGVVADAQGNVYIADTMNHRIRRIDAVTGMITTVAGGGTLQGAAADGGSALQASLLYPNDVALDTSDHLYVRGLFGLQAIDLKTGLLTTLLPNVRTTGGMVFDGDKTLYIAASHLASGGPYLTNNDQVWALDLTTGTPTVIAGNGDISQQPTGDGGPATKASLYDVRGLALDGKGNLYVADLEFNNVRRINLATGIIQTFANEDLNNPYAAGYSGDGSPAVNAVLAQPTGLLFDGAGHLILMDSGNDVLRQIDLTTNVITTIAGNHVRGFGGDGGSASGAMFFFPTAVTSDPSGNLIIADTYNNRVRRVVLHPTKLHATLTYGGSSSGGVTFTATYNGLSFGIAPTGTVTFLNGSATLGTGAIAAATDGSANYVATLTATSAPTNAITITAQYSGDVHYAAATTTIGFQQLTPSYTVSAKPASLTVKQGSSGSVTFTVTPQNGFNQAVSFLCDNATLPKGVTCSFSPASVTPNGSAAVTSTLTVQTTGATVVSLDRRTTHGSGWLRGGAVLALLLFGIPGARRRSWPSVLMMLIVLSIGGGMIGCGGGGSGNTDGGTQTANATPPGAYSIQVTTSVSTTTNASPVKVALTVTQ